MVVWLLLGVSKKADNDIIIGSVYMPFNDNNYRRHYDDFLDYLVCLIMTGYYLEGDEQ